MLRVLDENGVRARDLPRSSGVSNEAISITTGFLAKSGDAMSQPDPGSRGQVVRVTAKGRMAQMAIRELLEEVEARWVSRFGASTIAGLRSALEEVAGDAAGRRSPHFPMVLHRGGYPDGS